MPDENILATLDSALRESRAQRSRLASRLADLEAEAERVRTQLNELDAIVSHNEAALFRILSSNFGSPSASSRPSDAEIEAALRRDTASGMSRGVQQPQTYSSPQRMQPQSPRD